MKKIKALTSLLFVLGLTCFGTAQAHVSINNQGHEILHTWKNTVTNQQIKASFLAFIKNKIYLEKADGKIESILLSQLSKEDYKFVKNRIESIEKINNSPTLINLPDYKANNYFTKDKNNNYFTENVSFAVLFILLFFTIFKLGLLKRVNLKRSFTGLVFAPSIALLSCSSYVNTATDPKMVTVPSFSPNPSNSNPNQNNPSPSVVDSTKNDPNTPKNANDTLTTAFDLFKDRVKTRKDNDYFYIESNGIPDHQMMVGITSWQQQVPLPQNYSGINAWSIPLNPVLSDNPVSTKDHFYRGAIAVAVNGIPIFNALNNRGDDALLAGELDKWGGHCGKADDYHYHIAPMNLEKIVGKNNPIAYSLDGFAIYGSSEPDGSSVKPLDENNGHFGDNKIYHYHGTSTYPYTIGKMRGVIKTDGEQIIPQPRLRPARPPLEPLRGAVITDFKVKGEQSYSLEYTLNGNKNYVNYGLNGSEYKFDFVDYAGKSTTSIFKNNN